MIDESLDALFAPLPEPRAKRAPKESDLQAKIIDALNALPAVHVWKAGAYAGRASYRDRATGAIRDRFVKIGRAGVADVIGWRTITLGSVRVAQFIAIEVKRPGESPKPHQQRFLDRVAKAGGVAMVARSVDDVREALRR